MPESNPKIFLATALGLHTRAASDEVNKSYRKSNEEMIKGLRANNFVVYNTLSAYDYVLGDGNTDIDEREENEIRSCHVYLEIKDAFGSRGNAINLGGALILGKTVILSHTEESPLKGREQAMVTNRKNVHEMITTTPLDYDTLHSIIG